MKSWMITKRHQKRIVLESDGFYLYSRCDLSMFRLDCYGYIKDPESNVQAHR